ASLAGLEAGDPLAPARIRLAHAIVLGFGGLPVIWMGDELGMLNDPAWAEEPGHGEDSRWANRPRMPWPTPDDAYGVNADLRALIAARKALPHLHASAAAQVLDPRDPGVLLVARPHPLGTMLGAYNVTDAPAHVPHQVLHDLWLEPGWVLDRITARAPESWDDAIQLPAYGAVWLTSTTGHLAQPAPTTIEA
ncbi:MAG: alpha-amylase, partial [Marmoricola sp.]